MTKKEFIKKIYIAKMCVFARNPACCSLGISPICTPPIVSQFINLIKPTFGRPGTTSQQAWLHLDNTPLSETQGYRLMCLGLFKEICLEHKLYKEF